MILDQSLTFSYQLSCGSWLRSCRPRRLLQSVTTFIVGELSAIKRNSRCFCKVCSESFILSVHPPRRCPSGTEMMLHHILGNSGCIAIANMSKDIVCVICNPDDLYSAQILIDSAISQSYLQTQAVCITLPNEILMKEVEGKRLKTLIDFGLPPLMKQKRESML